MREDEVLDIVKKKRTRPDKAEQWQLKVDGKELQTQIDFAVTLFNLPDIDTNDAKAVQNRLGEYFTLCNQFQMKPSFAGMASALGVDRATLWKWCNDLTPSKPRSVVDTVKKARNMLNNMLESWMQNGQVNPVVGIFLGKNNFNYADKTEVEITPKNPLNDGLADRAQLEERYRAAVVAPDDGSDTAND